MSPTSVRSVWLIPRAEDTARLKRTMDDIADKQKGPQFQPHSSIGSLTSSRPNLSDVFGTISELDLVPIEIDRTDSFTMSLFIRFEMSKALSELRQTLEGADSFKARRVFDPHLSLCYGPPPEAYASIAKPAELLDQPIRFDQIWMMDIEVPVVSHAQVRKWRKVGSLALSAGV